MCVGCIFLCIFVIQTRVVFFNTICCFTGVQYWSCLFYIIKKKLRVLFLSLLGQCYFLYYRKLHQKMGQQQSSNSHIADRSGSSISIEPLVDPQGDNAQRRDRGASTNFFSRFWQRYFGGACRKRKREGTSDDDTSSPWRRRRPPKAIRLDASTFTDFDTRDAWSEAVVECNDASSQTSAEEVKADIINGATNGSHVNGETLNEMQIGWLDFPFLVDKRSILHSQVSRTMLIMRGLSGSGKSTIVNAAKAKFPDDCVSCSADDYFYGADGVYHFDEKKLKDAHSYCQSRAEEMCGQGRPLVIVDNTNVKRWEMAKYFGIAERFLYAVVLVEPKTPWRLDAAQLAQKNSHGVPFNVICRKVKDFELVTPRYYGWFLNLTDSLGLVELADSLLMRCLHSSKMLNDDFKKFSGLESSSDMLNFYSRRNCRGVGATILHCTSKFMAKGESKEYANRQEVNECLGKTTVIQIHGFSISSQTFGAKLELTESQLPLWDQNDNEMPRPNNSKSTANAHQHSVPFPELPEKDDLSLSSLRISSTPSSDLEIAQGEFGRRAHITIGTSGSNPPVLTGPETSLAVKQVRAARYTHSETLHTGDKLVGGQLFRLAPTHWFLQLDRVVLTNALFTGQY